MHTPQPPAGTRSHAVWACDSAGLRTNKGDACRRLSRFVHYLLQTTLGPGSAGTPSASPGQAMHLELPLNMKNVLFLSEPLLLECCLEAAATRPGVTAGFIRLKLSIDCAGLGQNAALDIGKVVASKAWPSVQDPIVDSRTADNELRTLSAAAR